MVQRSRLRWYGRILRRVMKIDKKWTTFEVEGAKQRRLLRKT